MESEIIADILYVHKARNKMTPKQAAALIKKHNCKGICFGLSRRVYDLDTLKDIKDWKELKLKVYRYK
jgi:hypothetical protein